jgi:hypothetical protein
LNAKHGPGVVVVVVEDVVEEVVDVVSTDRLLFVIFFEKPVSVGFISFVIFEAGVSPIEENTK